MPEIKADTTKTDTKTSLPEPAAVWRGVLGKLQLSLSEYVYRICASQSSLQNFTQNSVDLICPNDLALKQLKNFEPLLQESINEIGKGNYKILFKVSSAQTRNDKKAKIKQQTKENEAPLFEAAKEVKQAQRNSGLTPDYTFENYIMGDSNRLAYSIAWAIAENPGKDYNPMFLYSGVGLGKTHLVQAIGNKIIKDKPDFQVIYTTGEEFANELISIIQTSQANKKYETDKFRKKYRNADVLIIDDVQFIIGKETTQKEFFHTFNALHLAGKQIILTSDRPPKDFINLEERLTSRFGSGITADIQHADAELRIAILRARRDMNQEAMSNEVINFIAEKVDTNIRELKGAYLQVLTEAKAAGVPPTIEAAARVLGQVIPQRKRQSANPNTIMNAVCKYFQVNKSDIKGRRRTKNIVIPRQIAMYLLRDMTQTPLEAIGELLGGRDHTTVMHGTDKVAELIQEEPRTRQDIENIRDLIYTM